MGTFFMVFLFEFSQRNYKRKQIQLNLCFASFVLFPLPNSTINKELVIFCERNLFLIINIIAQII